MHTLTGALAALVVGIAAALVIVAIAILPFLSPAWVGFEQGRAQAAAWTGYTTAELRTATDAILADLVIGPPDFDVALDGVPVLIERERGHMRDVRGVFAALLPARDRRRRRARRGRSCWLAGRRARARLWRRLGLAGRVIAVATVALGIVGVLFFDRRSRCSTSCSSRPARSCSTPATDRLVQLFPEPFWVETTIAVGVVIIVLAAGLAWFGGRRARTLEARVEAPRGLGRGDLGQAVGDDRPRPRRSRTAADDERRRADRPDVRASRSGSRSPGPC